MIPPEIQNVIESGFGVILATADARLRPEVATATGLEISPDFRRLKIFLGRARATSSLANLEENPRLAISISRPVDNSAFQFKGKVLAVRAATPSEIESSKSQWNRYLYQASMLGIAPYVLGKIQCDADTTIEAELSEAFNQTPGSQAGRPYPGNAS